MQDISTRTGDSFAQQYERLSKFGMDLRVACPAIVKTVDYERQTLTCAPAIKERMNDGEGNLSWVEIPILLDVPFFVYSGGGYCLTLPIQPEDDCLVVFGDSCIDAWWQNGGIQNQVESRRHDLSDGFAIVGFRSQPQKVSGYSSGTAQLRNKAGSAYVEISGGNINIVGGSINISGSSINLSAGGVNIGGSTTIDGKDFLSHKHTDILSGPDNTGGVA